VLFHLFGFPTPLSIFKAGMYAVPFYFVSNSLMVYLHTHAYAHTCASVVYLLYPISTLVLNSPLIFGNIQ